MSNKGYSETVGLVRRFNVVWSDERADWVYELVTFEDQKNGERYIKDVARGDKKWAKANAKHYNILVPKPEEPETI